MVYKKVLGIVPGLQATALAMSVYPKNIAPKYPMKSSKKMSMRKPIKNIVKKGVLVLAGIALIKPTAQMINDL